ncbi:hypothetical protein H7J77_12290 [Mycolicibacillus parakoreensis]|uniref:Transposase n=1 Tax=Mycolicibacillus parakoreensis TaxID=1069221 RepID=A0ABY3U466_9MYCO|nr:hypothetical protein [Mycolicibacillus parakoreensis]MCV7316315.1 hypothetical protein [Mycolicibacillus parakoreensis]ULN52561.1 hypothetical protein MIU77_17270 [Mycolicibacillus parakoreensis]
MTHPNYRRPPVRRGEDHLHARLNDELVREIRVRYATGNCTHRSLAAEFEVSHFTVGEVLRRRRWTHVK